MKLTLPYPPSVNNYWRSIVISGRGRVVLSREARTYKKRVGDLCALAGVRPLDGPVHLVLHAYRPRKVGDIDGTLKATLDALQGFAYLNDSQIVKLEAERFDDKHNPRMEVTIEPA